MGHPKQRILDLVPQMTELFKQGEDIYTIARHLNVRYETVARYLERCGLIAEQRMNSRRQREERMENEAITKADIARLRSCIRVGDTVPVVMEVADRESANLAPIEICREMYVTKILDSGRGVLVSEAMGERSVRMVTYVDILQELEGVRYEKHII